MWDLEKEAQAAAFDAVQPGAPCESVDAAARRVLARAGLGPDYRLPGLPHRTGHGIGLSIHEPAYLVRGEDRKSVVSGKSGSVRVDIGGARIIKKNKTEKKQKQN